MTKRQTFGVICAVLCLIASALIIYGFIEDNRATLIIGMFLALAAAGVGARWRRQAD